MANATVEAGQLDSEWRQLQPAFYTFHTARDLTGTWNELRTGRLAPNIPPELEPYAEGLRSMAGMMEDDLRIYKGIKVMNPTHIDTRVRGQAQAARDLESDWKLFAANCWDNYLNPERWLDDYVAEGQLAHGLTIPMLKFKKHCYEEDGGRPVSTCPLEIETTLLDGCNWLGNYRNPSAFWYRYSVPVMDNGIKRKDGKKPTLNPDGSIGWLGEHEPYWGNGGTGGSNTNFLTDKYLEVIVRDAEDELGALCPLDGCDHIKRKITVYVCPQGAKDASSYEEVETYDSPFKSCSFMIIAGDIRQTARDPHRIFLPEMWVLYNLLNTYNLLFTELLVAHRREQADERKYLDTGSSTPEALATLDNAEGGDRNMVEMPDIGSREIATLPGTVRAYGQPSTEHLKYALNEIKEEYRLRRPNPALTGQMQVSNTTGTGVQAMIGSAGVPIGPGMSRWDGGIGRIFEETRHAIRFTGYFEPDNAQTKYVATVTGKENVKGYRGSAKAGDEVYIDAKKAETPVQFLVHTSKDTPAESRERKQMAVLGKHEGIYSTDDLLEQWDIFDVEAQKRALAKEQLLENIQPAMAKMEIALATRRASERTGINFGDMMQIDQLDTTTPDHSEQTHNTMAANDARLNAPPVTLAPTGVPEGGNSGLAGG